MHSDTFLEEIRQVENGNIIKTTEEYIGSRKANCDKDFKEFRPSIIFKAIIYCIFGGLLAFIISYAFRTKPLTNSEIGGMIAGGICLMIILINAVNQFSVDKKMNFKIRIDNSGISIDNVLYRWDNIYETAIMKNFAGKSTYCYLVIATNNMSTYESYDLTNFKSLNPFGFGMTIAKYIEHFKPAKTIKLRPT